MSRYLIQLARFLVRSFSEGLYTTAYVTRSVPVSARLIIESMRISLAFVDHYFTGGNFAPDLTTVPVALVLRLLRVANCFCLLTLLHVPQRKLILAEITDFGQSYC